MVSWSPDVPLPVAAGGYRYYLLLLPVFGARTGVRKAVCSYRYRYGMWGGHRNSIGSTEIQNPSA